MNTLNREQIITKAINHDGFFLNTDNIRYDLDGAGMAEYLESIGFKVLAFHDMGGNGLVITRDNLTVSTNGYTVSRSSEELRDICRRIYNETDRTTPAGKKQADRACGAFNFYSNKVTEEREAAAKAAAEPKKKNIPAGRMECPRCGGTGRLSHYAHYDNGICFKCKGVGHIIPH